MTVKRKNPFIVDKPDHKKIQAELIDDYIGYYNHDRRKLKLKKLGSVAYRTQLEKTA